MWRIRNREEVEMIKKVMALSCDLILSLSILVLLFLLIPSGPVFADFSDSASVADGIKLTLGNLSLSPEKDEILTGLTYSGEDPVELSSHILKNNGTLTGKLAYQIHVTEKGTTIPVADSGMQLILSFDTALGDKVIEASEVNTSEYTFITDSKNNEWIFEADQEETVPVTIKYKSNNILDKDRDIEITVTFLLVQTNASEPEETMFYDKVSFKHEVKLKANVNEVPDPIDPEYWPAADDKDWNWNGEVRYNDAQFENIMYFSEVESSDRVHNLNDNVLYIELPEGKTKEDNNFSITQTAGSRIKSEVMKNKRHIKLTFSFDSPKSEAEKIVSQNTYYTVEFHYGKNGNSYGNFRHTLLPLVKKRILLSSDGKIPGVFKPLPIQTTLEQDIITFKNDSENRDDVYINDHINLPLSDAILNYKQLEASIIEGSALFDLSLHKDGNKDYLLLNTTTTDWNKKGKLKIILVGNNGNRLVIYRDLMIAKEAQAAALSQSIDQNEANLNLETKEIQAEPGEYVVEEPADSEEIKKQDEPIQNSSSEKQTPEDSSIMVPEEQSTVEETLPMTEPIQEKPADDGADNPIIEKDVPAQENKPEQNLKENEALTDEKLPLK